MTVKPSAAPRSSAGGPCCFLLLGLLLLSGCGETRAAAPATPAALPPLRTRSEGVASGPCGPLWPEGEQVTLRGFYRTSGNQAYIDVSHILTGAPPCWARFFLDRDLGLGAISWDSPAYVEVTGQASTERWSSAGLWDLQVTRWTDLSWSSAAATVACRQAVAAQAATLRGIEWSSLASPAYVTGTVGFRPAVEDLASLSWRPIGADDSRPLLLLEARGPDLPPVRPLVYRWVSVDCVYSLETQQVAELVATIRGEVQE
jgi:hypothetical protein